MELFDPFSFSPVSWSALGRNPAPIDEDQVDHLITFFEHLQNEILRWPIEWPTFELALETDWIGRASTSVKERVRTTKELLAPWPDRLGDVVGVLRLFQSQSQDLAYEARTLEQRAQSYIEQIQQILARRGVLDLTMEGMEDAIAKVDIVVDAGLGPLSGVLGPLSGELDGHLEQELHEEQVELISLQNSLRQVRNSAFGPGGISQRLLELEQQTSRQVAECGAAETHDATTTALTSGGAAAGAVNTALPAGIGGAALGRSISAVAAGFNGKNLGPSMFPANSTEWCSDFVHMVVGRSATPPGTLEGLDDYPGANSWTKAAFATPPTTLTIAGKAYKLVPVGPGQTPEAGDIVVYYTPGSSPSAVTAFATSETGVGVHHVGIVSGVQSNGSLIATQGNWEDRVMTDQPGGAPLGTTGSFNGQQWNTYQLSARDTGVGAPWDAVVLRLEPA